MTNPMLRWMRLATLLVPLVVAGGASAQGTAAELAQVEMPATRSGPLLVLLTGADGAATHLAQARAFAGAGWVVHVVDSNRLMSDPQAALQARLRLSLAQPEVRSAKAALVGYSLGGWLVIAYGNRMPEQVSAAVAYYPSTFRAGEPKAFLASPPLTVPTLLLAGVKDTYMNCCTIDRARALAAAAALPDLRVPLRLVEYPQADHGFVLPAYPPVYRPADEADAFGRAVDHLRSADLR